MSTGTYCCVLGADFSSILTKHPATNLLWQQATAATAAGVICVWSGQPENGAALHHAAVQCATFALGHGKFDMLA